MASDWASEVSAPTDEELLIATDAARRNSYADYAVLAAEVRRRGLQVPAPPATRTIRDTVWP